MTSKQEARAHTQLPPPPPREFAYLGPGPKFELEIRFQRPGHAPLDRRSTTPSRHRVQYEVQDQIARRNLQKSHLGGSAGAAYGPETDWDIHVIVHCSRRFQSQFFAARSLRSKV